MAVRGRDEVASHRGTGRDSIVWIVICDVFRNNLATEWFTAVPRKRGAALGGGTMVLADVDDDKATSVANSAAAVSADTVLLLRHGAAATAGVAQWVWLASLAVYWRDRVAFERQKV